MRIAMIAVLVSAGVASAGPSQIIGKLVDNHQRPLEAATVTVGDQRVTSTFAGVYRLLVPGPGTYKVSIDYADSHVEREVNVDGPLATLDATIAVDSESTIVIHDKRELGVSPERSDDPNWSHQPEYTDEAVLSDRWAKAWLLLDIDDTGHVSRLKLLNDPGMGLGDVAVREGFKMTFHPARDTKDHAMATLIVVPIEWPSYTWLIQRWGTASHFFNRMEYMECRGHGPLMMESIDIQYRDCTEADLANAPLKKWRTR
jgi:hypothetical protein